MTSITKNMSYNFYYKKKTITLKSIKYSLAKRTMMTSGGSNPKPPSRPSSPTKNVNNSSNNTSPELTPISAVNISQADNTSANYDITKIKSVTKNDFMPKLAKNNDMPKPLSEKVQHLEPGYYGLNKPDVKKNAPNIKESVKNSPDKIVQTNTNTEIIKTVEKGFPNTNISNPPPDSSFTETDIEDVIGMPAILHAKSMIFKNNIPIPPHLPEKFIVPVVTPNSKTFQEEFQQAVKEREKRSVEIQENLSQLKKDLEKKNKELIRNILQLEKEGLLQYQDDQEKLAVEFYKYLNNDKNLIPFDFTNIGINTIIFEVGCLEVTAIDETTLLKGIHTHVAVVCSYCEQNSQTKKVMIGYLTSFNLKGLTIKLSDNQPFNFDLKNKKPQNIVFLKTPLLISKTEQLTELPTYTLFDGTIKDQQKIGQDYVNSEHIRNILQNNIVKQVKQENNYLEVYEGKGITAEDINNVLQKKQAENEINAQDKFKDYFNRLKQKKEVVKWLDNIQKAEPGVYEKLQQLIDKHENK